MSISSIRYDTSYRASFLHFEAMPGLYATNQERSYLECLDGEEVCLVSFWVRQAWAALPAISTVTITVAKEVDGPIVLVHVVMVQDGTVPREEDGDKQ